MNTCERCGAPIEANDNFCGICGAPLMRKTTGTALKSSVDQKICRTGTIFTDTQALASKFNVSRETIIGILNKYIKSVAGFINYQLLDIYEKLRQETLMPVYSGYGVKDWKAYHNILHKYSLFKNKEVTEYLFIIGGEDIIPMPEVPNAFTTRDTIIPTDFLYAYSNIVSKQTIEIINSISSQNICYHVGRLPLGSDASLDFLTSYLERASKKIETGIPVQMTYAQSDPTWKRTSLRTISELSYRGLIPEVNIDPSLCYENIFLSPYITVDTVENVFNPFANLFYFNLHGSDDPQNPNFSGYNKKEDDNNFYSAISPKSFKTAEFDNIIVTEACYGGKFQGLKTNQSILLTSLASTTLVYIGSSVTAIGSVDPNDESITPNISCADVLAQQFIRALISGKTAGEALTYTRHILYNGNNLSNLLTILEFSLYGDPALTARFPASITTEHKIEDVPVTLSAKGDYENISREVLYSDKQDSILSFVRARVDRRFDQVQSEIQQYLSYYGVKPRKLYSVMKFRKGMNAETWYTYDEDDSSIVLVIVDSNNNKTVLSSKGRSIEERLAAGRRVHINYATIFRNMCRRFGLIPQEAIKMQEKLCIYSIETWRNHYGIEDLLIDSRIEDVSRLQVKTFNIMLDEAYRKRMTNYNLPGLSIKSQSTIDFAALMNPLCLILENELRQSVWEFLKSRNLLPRKNGKVMDATLGNMTRAMGDHPNVMRLAGIPVSFSKKFNKEFRDSRNEASHRGSLSEDKFIDFYKRFASIINDEGFNRLMEIKEQFNTK